MKTNVGSYDCAVRFVGGCVLLLLGNHFLGWWGLLGLFPIATAVFGFCPAYTVFRIDTTDCDKHEHHM